MEDIIRFVPDSKLKLMDQVRQVLRHYEYSYNTEKIYCGWVIKYIKFFNSQEYSPKMKGKEIEVFINHLITEKKVSPATQKQALNSLFFLYKKVLNKPLPEQIKIVEARQIRKLPIVLDQNEIKLIFSNMKNTHLLMAKLLYGCGLRLMECLRLRLQDINFTDDKILVRAFKNGKDRFVMLPESIKEDLFLQKNKIREIHKADLHKGYGSIDLPESMGVRSDTCVKTLAWQYLFPAKNRSKDPRSGKVRRYHVIESGIQKAVKAAGKHAGLTNKITCQILRNSFAVHLLEKGVNIKTVQELMGHSNLKMTKVFFKVMKKTPPIVTSPLDDLIEYHD